MKNNKITLLNFFFCPASEYLNQYNETGSHGQIAYQFMKHLANKPIVYEITAVAMRTLQVEPIKKTKIISVFNSAQNNSALHDFDSFYFYLYSFFTNFFTKRYKKTNVVHHIIPFAFGRSFNLFFLWKNTKKTYVIGPIIGPHINAEITADEEYVFKEKLSLFAIVKNTIINHSKTLLLGLFGKLLRYISLKTFQNADIVLFSDNHAFQYHKKFLLPYQKGMILDTGIDTSIFKPSNKRIVNNVGLKVLFVGRLTKRKGCEYLLKALYEAKQLKKDIKIECQILGVGPLREELETLVRNLKLTDSVQFIGGVKSNEEIVKKYYQADIVCLPALSETFTVTKEALCSGKPVIVTDVCSNAERIDEGVNGFIVPPKNPKAIAKILVKLSRNRPLIRELSRNALKSRSLYDWDIILDRYVSLLAKRNEKV